jgi:hypothetical protein
MMQHSSGVLLGVAVLRSLVGLFGPPLRCCAPILRGARDTPGVGRPAVFASADRMRCARDHVRPPIETFSLIENLYGGAGISDHRYVCFRIAWSEGDAKE